MKQKKEYITSKAFWSSATSSYRKKLVRTRRVHLGTLDSDK